jgi:hypothetical protein
MIGKGKVMGMPKKVKARCPSPVEIHGSKFGVTG